MGGCVFSPTPSSGHTSTANARTAISSLQDQFRRVSIDGFSDRIGYLPEVSVLVTLSVASETRGRRCVVLQPKFPQ